MKKCLLIVMEIKVCYYYINNDVYYFFTKNVSYIQYVDQLARQYKLKYL